jgi:hypothetical protein
MGATTLIVGKATQNAKAHALSQTNNKLSIKPTLKM